MSAVFQGRRIATADPPPPGIPNPIHNSEGADAAGYAGALVAGIRTYGWAVQTVVEALGDEWLTSGWVDYSLRRPLFAGEELVTTVARDGDQWSIECTGRGVGGERTVLGGAAGLGEAAWLDDLDPPAPAAGVDPPQMRPTYTIDTVPIGEPLRPLRAYVRHETAQKMASEDLVIDDPRYLEAVPANVHPFFLAGRMAPLTRHNFTYGPTIHVRSQIQHMGDARADQEFTVGARIVDAYERNEHWYQVLDGTVTGFEDNELARIRHHTIFRPRGTTLPPPITSE